MYETDKPPYAGVHTHCLLRCGSKMGPQKSEPTPTSSAENYKTRS